MPTLGMTWEEIIAVGLTVFVAGLVRGFSGFGSALIVAPMLSLFVGPRVAVPAILIMHIVTTAQLFPGALKTANWSRVLPLSVAGCLCVPLGTYLLVAVDQDLLRRSISVTIVIFAAIMFAGWRYTGPSHPALVAGIGGVGGVLSGAASIGGPPVILFLLAGEDRAASNRATIIFYFLFTQIVGVVGFSVVSGITQRILLLSFFMLPTQVVGIWIGERLSAKSSDVLFRRIALTLVLCVGLATLIL